MKGCVKGTSVWIHATIYMSAGSVPGNMYGFCGQSDLCWTISWYMHVLYKTEARSWRVKATFNYYTSTHPRLANAM